MSGLFRFREGDPQVTRRQKKLIPSDSAEISQFPLSAKIQCKMLIYKYPSENVFKKYHIFSFRQLCGEGER